MQVWKTLNFEACFGMLWLCFGKLGGVLGSFETLWPCFGSTSPFFCESLAVWVLGVWVAGLLSLHVPFSGQPFLRLLTLSRWVTIESAGGGAFLESCSKLGYQKNIFRVQEISFISLESHLGSLKEGCYATSNGFSPRKKG